ncbi:hypothetical protein CFP56_032235 [Quercus suber]|uniref:RNase H type-1 domain-containing protein n=1 Tax=Quercus suber TaxID=58331 RepID=A0AAW0LRY2_QUESU
MYKANFDAALFEHLGFAGLGVVVRDCCGNVLVALSQKVALPQFVEMAEALAAKRVLQLATEMSFLRVMVEGDCKRVVQALQAPVWTWGLMDKVNYRGRDSHPQLTHPHKPETNDKEINNC